MPKRLNNGEHLPTVQLGASQDVTISGTSAQSAAIGTAGGSNVLVRVVATTACRILEGSNPTAVATSTLLPAGVVEYLEVTAGNKIAGIQESAGGKLNITVCITTGG